MAINYLHGIETIEVSSGLRAITTVKSSVIGLVGTAPDADAALFPLNTPVLLTSNPTKANALGAAGTLLDAVNAIYSQQAATVIVIRVEEGATLKETYANVVGSATGKTGVWALLKARPTLKLVPKILIAPGLTEGRPTDGLVSLTISAAGTDYVAASTKVIISAPAAGGRQAQATAQIVGGKLTGIAIVDPGYGYTAAPTVTIEGAGTGATATASLGAVANPVAKSLEAVSRRLRAVAFVDGPRTTYEDAVAYRDDFGSDRIAVIDPGVLVFDTVTAEYVARPAAAYAAGIQARIDVERGFWYSFSNQEILNIGGPSRPVDYGYSDVECEANLLNSNQITTVVHDDGFRFHGLRSTTSDNQWSFLTVRRTADMIYESLEQAHRSFLAEPIGTVLLSTIEDSVNAYLQTLKRRGALLGGKCRVDANANTKDQLIAGILTVDFDLEPPASLEHLIFQAHRNPEYYTEFVEEFAARVAA